MPTNKSQLHQVIKAIYGQLAQRVVRSLTNVLEPAIELSKTVVKTKDPEKARRGYERLSRTLCHIRDIIRPLTALDEEPEGEERFIDLSAEVLSLESFVRQMVREDISLNFTIPKDVDTERISSHPFGIKLILTALVARMQQLLPLGGEINVRTEETEVQDQLAYHFGGLAPGSYSVLKVTAHSGDRDTEIQDDTPLITDEDLQNFIFSFGGAHLDFSDDEGEWQLAVYFPRATEEIDKESVKGLVLICDDNECVVELTQHFLEDGGYEVLPTTAPDMALDTIDEHRGKVDLCLIDIVMPSMSGPALFKCLRTIQPDLRVVFSSGYDKVPAISRRIPEGAFFLSKPMKEEELLRIVDEALSAPVPGE